MKLSLNMTEALHVIRLYAHRNSCAEALAGLEAFPAEVYPQQLDYANSAIVDIWLEWAAQKEEYNV